MTFYQSISAVQKLSDSQWIESEITCWRHWCCCCCSVNVSLDVCHHFRASIPYSGPSNHFGTHLNPAKMFTHTHTHKLGPRLIIFAYQRFCASVFIFPCTSIALYQYNMSIYQLIIALIDDREYQFSPVYTNNSSVSMFCYVFVLYIYFRLSLTHSRSISISVWLSSVECLYLVYVQ